MIRKLPDTIASQIAAGEVVERPASVVKELLENAIDAGAKNIDLHIEQAGVRLIEVSDNGSGIPLDQLGLAVDTHSTSKLQTAEDLFAIQTLGFRGEALASIASVSQLSIASKTEDTDLGGLVEVEGGKAGKIEPLGLPTGTTVRVSHLFFNVPARLKFLKTLQTEKRQIDTLVSRYALAYPGIRFHLQHDGHSVLKTSGNGVFREVFGEVYGLQLAKQMMTLTLEEDTFRLHGFVSPSSITRANRREMTFFVNGRWVQDKTISSAVLAGYQNLLPVGRYPLVVLFLELPAESVDVNVHPAKAEIRFRDSKRIFELVQRAVRRAMLTYSPLPNDQPKSTWQHMPSDNHSRELDLSWDGRIANPESESLDFENPYLSQNMPEPQPALPATDLPLLRVIGQIGQTYIIAEGPDGMYLIDQHAAHSRVLYERLIKAEGQPIPSQNLLEPVVLTFPPQEANDLETIQPLLSRFGFQIEPFGPQTVQIRAVPSLIQNQSPELILRSMLENFSDDEKNFSDEIELRYLARLSRQAAVRPGQALTVVEQNQLVRDLETCLSPRSTPYGKPTMIHLSVDLLERQFGKGKSREIPRSG
jgi:DNA mismatch repair protein MutL